MWKGFGMMFWVYAWTFLLCMGIIMLFVVCALKDSIFDILSIALPGIVVPGVGLILSVISYKGDGC